MHAAIVLETHLSGLTLARRGKVRDVYDLGEHLLIVATDRISAFDYILGSGIPDKGKVLTQLSAFWFGRIGSLMPHHLVSIDVADFPAVTRPHRDTLRGRSMLVKKTEPLPVECVARGFLSGSGWKDYQRTGAVCGISLPPGLRESDRLPETLFTPATKAESGHDENISEAQAGAIVGVDLVARLRALTLAIYGQAVRPRGDLRHHHRRHQVRVRRNQAELVPPKRPEREGGRPGSRHADPHRRGADA